MTAQVFVFIYFSLIVLADGVQGYQARSGSKPTIYLAVEEEGQRIIKLFWIVSLRQPGWQTHANLVGKMGGNEI